MCWRGGLHAPCPLPTLSVTSLFLPPSIACTWHTSICECLDALEEGQEVSRQSCGHCFHHECMATWLDSQLQQKKVGCCPHCQETIVAPIIQHQQVPCAAARAEERRPSGTRTTVRRFFARLFKN